MTCVVIPRDVNVAMQSCEGFAVEHMGSYIVIGRYLIS